MKKIFHFIGIGLWCILGWIIFKYMRHFIHEPDIWWHLANGRFMVENLTFLPREIFSHTYFGAEWINFEWLSQVFLYVLMKTTGVVGLFVWKIFFGLSSVFLLWVLAWKLGARGPLLFLLTWSGYHILQVRLCTRVELFTLNLLPLFLILILTARDAATSKQRNMISWILFGLTILWCNLHAGYIYGLGLLVAFCMGARWDRAEKSFVRFLDRTLTLALVAVLINPYGPRLVEVFIHVMSDFKQAEGLLAEWHAPSIRSTPYFWSAFAMTGFLIIFALVRRQKSARFWIPVLLMFMVYGSRYYRSTALLAFFAVPFAAMSLKNWEDFFPSNARQATLVLGWVLCACVLVVDVDFLVKKYPPGIVDWNIYPAGSCQFVKDKKIDGKMYNTMSMGGYIGWALGPERKVFMDGRYLFYPLLIEEQKILDDTTRPAERLWQDHFEKYKVDYAITRYESYANQTLLSAMFPVTLWALVYWDDASLVFLKRTPEHVNLIREYEYRFVRPYDPKATISLASRNRTKIVEELKRNKREASLTRRASWLMGLLK